MFGTDPAEEEEVVIPAPVTRDKTTGDEPHEDEDSGEEKGNDVAGEDLRDAGLGEVLGLQEEEET